MAKVKVLARIGEFDETYLPDLRAVVKKAGVRFCDLKQSRTRNIGLSISVGSG
jgi:hypothetical protein